MLDENAWRTASVADSFINKWPTDNGKAILQTEVSVTYDDDFIYFGIKAAIGNKDLVIQSLKRDVIHITAMVCHVSTLPIKIHLVHFWCHAAGAQMEGIVQVNSASFDWDSKWFSASKKIDGYWTAELAIPFKSIRFPSDQSQWGINFIRNDMTNNCFSTWNQVPIQFFGANLNCLGKISFVDGPPSVKTTMHSSHIYPRK